MKFPTSEKQKIEKIHAKENNHTHKTIFTWFGNLSISTKLQEFHYYQGKYKGWLQCFFTLSQDDNNTIKKNHTTLFRSGQVKSSTRSNTTRLHKAQHKLH